MSLLLVQLFTVTVVCFDDAVAVFVEETIKHFVLTESRKQKS